MVENNDNRERNSDYAVNALFVLGFIASGDGGTEAARLNGLLGLPNSTHMDTRSFGGIEKEMVGKLQQFANDIILQNWGKMK